MLAYLQLKVDLDVPQAIVGSRSGKVPERRSLLLRRAASLQDLGLTGRQRVIERDAQQRVKGPAKPFGLRGSLFPLVFAQLTSSEAVLAQPIGQQGPDRRPHERSRSPHESDEEGHRHGKILPSSTSIDISYMACTIERAVSGLRLLSERVAGREEEPLMDGAPPHLRPALLHWLERAGDESKADVTLYQRLALRLRIEYDPVGYKQYAPSSGGGPKSPAGKAAAGRYFGEVLNRYGDEVLLDAVDLMLQVEGGPARSAPGDLEDVLEIGGSAWRVSVDGSHLERRVLEPVRDAVQRAIDEATAAKSSAAEHIKEAWRQTYGRNPDPTKAYSEAIKAVESAAIPVVLPNDKKATLGKVVPHLRNNKGDWECAVHPGSVDTPLAMMESLWQGQSDRHAGSTPTVPVKQAEAEAAVHLATTLVHWFLSGAIKRSSVRRLGSRRLDGPTCWTSYEHRPRLRGVGAGPGQGRPGGPPHDRDGAPREREVVMARLVKFTKTVYGDQTPIYVNPDAVTMLEAFGQNDMTMVHGLTPDRGHERGSFVLVVGSVDEIARRLNGDEAT